VLEKVDAFQVALDLAAFGAVVWGISEAWIRAKAFLEERRRDNSASEALSKALAPSKTDKHIIELLDKLNDHADSQSGDRIAGSEQSPFRAKETDKRLSKGPQPDGSPKEP